MPLCFLFRNIRPGLILTEDTRGAVARGSGVSLADKRTRKLAYECSDSGSWASANFQATQLNGCADLSSNPNFNPWKSRGPIYYPRPSHDSCQQ